MNQLLEPIVNSPDFPRHVLELQRLLAEERRRRDKFYEELTEDGKQEFINGQVVIHSPARSAHGVVVSNLCFLIKQHVRQHWLGRVYSENYLVAFPRNDYVPDVMFYGPEKSELINPETLKFPIPDLVIEVTSPSTEQNDRGIKFRDYEQAGIGEYWIVDPQTCTVEQFVLEGASYPANVARRGVGHLESQAVPGLRISIPDIFLADDQLTAKTERA
jgi:Uma2 family endonuclease